MASGVVSGAVALLLDQRPQLKPADAKAILQLTSSFMPSAGLLGAGAGSVDVAAAVAFAGDGSLEATSIAGETG